MTKEIAMLILKGMQIHQDSFVDNPNPENMWDYGHYEIELEDAWKSLGCDEGQIRFFEIAIHYFDDLCDWAHYYHGIVYDEFSGTIKELSEDELSAFRDELKQQHEEYMKYAAEKCD